MLHIKPNDYKEMFRSGFDDFTLADEKKKERCAEVDQNIHGVFFFCSPGSGSESLSLYDIKLSFSALHSYQPLRFLFPFMEKTPKCIVLR